ncbi:MAG: RIP metalloprotease RseP [Pseudomonadota bacterium]
MEVLSGIPLIGGGLAIIVPFLVVLSVVVFVHEYGHYIVGRWCGIKAEVFSIGFGRPLFGWTDRHGTRWQVAILPLGGFVRFVGDMDPASAGRADESELTPEESNQAFHNATLLSRSLTVAAGPAFNFVLAIIVFACLSMWLGRASNEPVIGNLEPPASESGLMIGDRVISVGGEDIDAFSTMMAALARTDGEPTPVVVERDGQRESVTMRYSVPPRVSTIRPGEPASRSGMLPGDLIIAINGDKITSFFELQVKTSDLEPETEILVDVERDGEPLQFSFTPTLLQRAHPETGEVQPLPTMGVTVENRSGIDSTRDAFPAHEAVLNGANQTWRIVTGTLNYLGDMIFANADVSQLGGPIRIAQVSSERAHEGVEEFIYLIAVLSASIGLLNLFPIPVLDGGHLLFYAVEAVIGRPVGQLAMKIGTVIGLSLVLLLMVFATYNDLSRL